MKTRRISGLLWRRHDQWRKSNGSLILDKLTMAAMPMVKPAGSRLSRNLARGKVYSKPERNLCLAQKYTSVQWQNSEVSAARDVLARDRPSLISTLVCDCIQA